MKKQRRAQRAVSFLLFILIVLVVRTKQAHAEVFASLGTQLVYEYGPNGRTFETRQPFSIRAGYRFQFADVYIDYGRFKVSQGSPLVQVAREHDESLIWLRRFFFQEWKFVPYAALGAGAEWDVVETSFEDERVSVSGKPSLLSSAAGGFSAAVHTRVELQLEFRLSLSPNSMPKPTPSGAAHVAWLF